MPGDEQEFSWTVHTHEHKERSTDWYWALGTIALVGAAASLFFGNILLGAIILIAALSLGVLAARGPREHAVAIHRRGISIDGTLYPFSAVHSFWIEREVPYPRLFLSMTGVLSPHFTLALPEHVAPEEIHNFLQKHIEEEEQGPHIGEHLAELIGL